MKFTALMIAFVILVSSSVYSANEPEDALILYMSFDSIDGEQTIDQSKHENHGEIIGDVKHVKGKFGKALEFHGDQDFVQIPHHETLTVDQDVTVMAWIHTERHTVPNDG
ncbi:hypothetical protein JT359_11545 [Candidatus Poribacteria bacterium]|nr:hypothetical protein [Candidatus Poribacteria bacterium]